MHQPEARRSNLAVRAPEPVGVSRVVTLGALRVSSRRLTRPKPLLLLAYLAHEGRTDRQRLASLFFPEASDPRDALSTSLARLDDLVDRGTVDDPRVGANVNIDSHEFLAAACERDTEAALALYQGPFVQGFDKPLGPELEEWVVATRELLACVARDLYLQAARTAASRGDRHAAWRFAQFAVRLTEAHTLDPTGVTGLLHELAEVLFPVPDGWWRALSHDSADWLANRGLGSSTATELGRSGDPARLAILRDLRSGDEASRGAAPHN